MLNGTAGLEYWNQGYMSMNQWLREAEPANDQGVGSSRKVR